MARAAQTYIEELMHLRPCGVYERNLWIRFLQQEDRIFEAEQSLKEGLKLCSDNSAVGILLYRLAFFEWKLGNNRLCSACYAQSRQYSSPVQEQADSEYEELIANSEQDIERLSIDEAEQILEHEGIISGISKRQIENIETIARIACNMGAFEIARPLTALLYNRIGQSYYKGIYYSMSKPAS